MKGLVNYRSTAQVLRVVDLAKAEVLELEVRKRVFESLRFWMLMI
jgi:hypothetical protein